MDGASHLVIAVDGIEWATGHGPTIGMAREMAAQGTLQRLVRKI